MSTKHTPGPWIMAGPYTYNGAPELYEIHWSADGECVAEIVHGEADAQLIAAAPELLEALQGIISMEPDSPMEGCTWGDTDFENPAVVYGYNMCLEEIQRKARAAIAKATGQ